MSSLITELFGRPHAEVTDRELLYFLIERQIAMALDLSALTAAVTKLTADVTSLINTDQTAINASAAGAAAQLTADQAAVNAVVPSITALSTTIEAALTPPAGTPTTAPSA